LITTIMAFHERSRNDSTPSHKRLYSIDLSLELERQLENESSPPSSALHQQSFNRQSLDPNVLASIVVQLRQSLAEVSEERDELRHRLSELQLQESRLKDALQDQTEKSTRAQDELETAKQKIRDDEDAITMLRTKVEESRCVDRIFFLVSNHPEFKYPSM
jgi:chromosome segregation ATPase